MYHIESVSNAGNFIALNPTTDQLTVATPTVANFAATLWCIDIETEVNGQNPTFDFMNKLGKMLDIDMDGVMANALPGVPSAQLSVGGDIRGWAFSPTYAEGVWSEKPLYSYYKADSVIALMNDAGVLRGVKLGADEIAGLTDSKYLFSLKRPERITLNALALNTMLGTNTTGTSFKLNFKDEATPNVFANELVARDTTGLTGYVTLTNKESGKYLRVDTAYNNTTGVKFIQITDTTSSGAYAASTATTLAGGLKSDNYAFMFEYSPASDSVFITVAGAILKKEDDKTWAESYRSNNRDSLHIYVQDLLTSNVLTVGTDSSKITLGFAVCGNPVEPSKTTVPSDLYVIKSTDGKYLAAPIHGDTTSLWVTLENNVNPWTMPSFQWVVEKQNKNSLTSPITVTSREFGSQIRFNVQLDKVTATNLSDAKGNVKLINALGFEAATPAVKADSLLGYKYLDAEDLLVTRYKFRYLHEFSDEFYAGTNAEDNDSVLYVGAKSPFSLTIEDALYPYGYTTTAVAGLKPLYRQSYQMAIRNTKLIFGKKAENVTLDNENRFAVTNADYNQPKLTFLIKTNNEKGIGEDDTKTLFYAFLKLGADTTKVGTDDNSLWMKNQVMPESRTSAFSVEVDDSPLYRRFWTEKEGTFANDDPDTVKFFRVNNPADMLFEDANSVYQQNGINFLGVSNSIQFPDAKRAIYVDTAYVNRGTGYIKPQYLLAMDVNIIPGIDAVPCPDHGFDPNCPHWTAGTDSYARGRYLINAVDSAKVNGVYNAVGNRDADYIWNNQVRLAFVEAIHKADTLYILDGDKAELADPVDFAALDAASVKKIRLDNNLHKNVVFSFRLLEEGNDDFLIESAETDANMIAPMNGGWVKIQNGVPVISYDAFADAANESEIFNVEKTAETPTSNEPAISAETVSVTTVTGAVIVKNAAGKNVVINNLLGQTITSTVITSSEATIAVPAGVVFVTIEGEEAVKAIVK